MQKILVVDDGHRGVERMLSAQLAELGYASVTASLDAADEILAIIPNPAAVVLHLPRRGGIDETQRFEALAERMKRAGLPVVTVDATGHRASSDIDLQSWMCSRVVNEPEL